MELEDERRLFYVAMTRAIKRLACIHPADARLRQSMRKGNARYPGPPPRASRFLYETNPGFSAELGEFLHDPAKTEKLPFSGEDTGIAEEYLKAVGQETTLTAVPREPAPPERSVGGILHIDDIAEGLSVWHAVFGAGTVVQVMDRKQGRVKVSFEEHGETILLAGYAKLQAFSRNTDTQENVESACQPR